MEKKQNAFRQGMKAFWSYDLYKEGNPYKKETPGHKDWERGFDKAYFSNRKKIDARKEN